MSDVTFGVKMPEELKQQLDELMKDSGLRTGKDFMQSLINSYVLEKTKESIPEVAEDLKELQILTQRIDNIYLNLGYRIDNITKAQQEETSTKLTKKDAIIADLQNKIAEFEAENEDIKEAYNNIVNLKNESLQRVNELTESNNNIKALIEEYKGKNDMLLGQLKQYEKFPEEIETLKELLSVQQRDNINLRDSIKDKEYTVNQLTAELEALKAKNEDTVKELNLKHKEIVQSLKDKAELEKDKALLVRDKNHQAELEKIQAKHNAEIESYQTKYKQLLEKLEQFEADKKTKVKKEIEK